MGKKNGFVSPAPPVIAEGSSAWHEYTVRRVMPDGRVVDSETMTEGAASMAATFSQFAVPPGSVVSVRRRLVSVVASAWEDVAAGEDGPTIAEALVAGEARTAEDLPMKVSRHTDADRSECECDECVSGHA